jgi:hypothetical protein
MAPASVQFAFQKENFMTTKGNAIGLLSIKIAKNGEPSQTMSTPFITLDLKSNNLSIGGYNIEPEGLEGAQIDIHEQHIQPGTYFFTEDFRVAGFYTPRMQNSWNGDVGGEITLIEVDLTKKFVRGTAKFKAVSKYDDSYAEVDFNFSLTGAQ